MKNTNIPVFLLTAAILASGSVNAQEAEAPYYPFQVTVAGQEATVPDADTAVAAVIAQPVAPDSKLRVDVEEVQTLLINVLPTQDGRTPVEGAQPEVIMARGENSVALDQTMSKKPLDPGKYLANVVATPPGKTSRVVFEVRDEVAAGSEDQAASSGEMPESFNLGMRRQATELTQKMADYEKEIAEITGKPIDLQVVWTGFTEEGLGNLEERGFKPVRDGLKAIASDDLGKQALAEKITTIHFINTDNDDWEKTGTISDEGVFLLEWEYGGMMAYNGDMVQQKLEKAL
jgi:hypothetical protein